MPNASLFHYHEKQTGPELWLPYRFYSVPPHCSLSPDSWCCSAKDQRTGGHAKTTAVVCDQINLARQETLGALLRCRCPHLSNKL